jgi:hypothetical protein
MMSNHNQMSKQPNHPQSDPDYPTPTLLRHHLRGMIDQTMLLTHLLLNQIEQERVTAEIDDVLELDLIELSGLAMDIRFIAEQLGLELPSQKLKRPPRPGRSAWSAERRGD